MSGMPVLELILVYRVIGSTLVGTGARVETVRRLRIAESPTPKDRATPVPALRR